MQYSSARWLLLALVLPACSPSSGGSPATTASGSGDGGSGGGATTSGPGEGGAGAGGRAQGGAGAGEGGSEPGPGSGAGGSSEAFEFEAGGERPVTVHVPERDGGEPAPLLLVLHGYASTGALAELYFAVDEAASARGVVFAAPDGLMDATTSRYWNGTAACCDYYDSQPDDVGYLESLVDEIGVEVAIDPKRVYVLGHSNGGFMAYRMACDAASRVAAIVSLSGATEYDPADCEPSEPVSVLEIHGTGDVVVPYAGGFIAGEPFPSATQTAETWAGYDGCDAEPEHESLTKDVILPIGMDADVDTYGGCEGDAAVELWTVPGGLHQPTLALDFADQALDFMLAHPKP